MKSIENPFFFFITITLFIYIIIEIKIISVTVFKKVVIFILYIIVYLRIFEAELFFYDLEYQVICKFF